MADKLKSYSEHLEELVEERTAKLREAERMAAMGQMAATVAHDLRNPLTGIAGAAYYLRKKYGSTTDDRTREMLEVIEKDVEYSSRMMTGLVEYSGELRLDLAESDLRTITEKALEFVRIPDNVHISNLAKSLPKATLDVEKMTRVAVNLIQNAVEAMPLGGAVTIRSQKLDSSLKFSVSDTGVGIREEAMSKIWVPFSTTKAKGMGLGLPMAKHIVEAHGGSISVKSTYGKGTTVTVTLPIRVKVKERATP
jgi:signal transduction histidine kinase